MSCTVLSKSETELAVKNAQYSARTCLKKPIIANKKENTVLDYGMELLNRFLNRFFIGFCINIYPVE